MVRSRTVPKLTLPGGIVLDGVPRFAVGIVAIVLALTVGATIWWTKVHQPELELVSAREANETALAKVVEFGKHIGEKFVSEFTLSESPLVQARLYKDLCTLLIYDTPDGLRSTLIPNLARDSHKAPKRNGELFSFLPTVLAAVTAGATRCDGIIHPPPFDTKYGIKQDCWIPVWRIYYDGCTHVQMFDACHGTWDQRVNWTVCRH